MTGMLLMAVLVLCVLAVFIFTVRARSGQLRSLEDFQARWQKVDIEAFANLVDPGEDRFLQERLPAREYRRIRRERLLAAWEYLGRVGGNARLMVQAGQIIQHHNSGTEAERARRHVDTAIRLRTAVFVAQCSLLTKIALPTDAPRLENVLHLYGDAAHSFNNVLDPAVRSMPM